MYNIRFYKDINGNQPVLDYIRELGKKNDKDSRLKLKKIAEYFGILEQKGTRAGLPFVKYLGNDLWEVRPSNDRIFFVVWCNNELVMLHHFRKKTQKTPSREISKARNNYKDLKERSKDGE